MLILGLLELDPAGGRGVRPALEDSGLVKELFRVLFAGLTLLLSLEVQLEFLLRAEKFAQDNSLVDLHGMVDLSWGRFPSLALFADRPSLVQFFLGLASEHKALVV